MTHTAEQLRALVAACEQFRGSKAPAGYHDGLALCVIDSVQSTGVTYSSVENVVARYRAYRRERSGDPNRDGVAELLGTVDELDGPDGWASRIGNSNRTSSLTGWSAGSSPTRWDCPDGVSRRRSPWRSSPPRRRRWACRSGLTRSVSSKRVNPPRATL
ncbi:hypothetical protein [Mycobacteroides abscessus]|uniref:hypothetical protein n=1 Tax=Mycobacteroides abscessus TaxID=36809 RepID=UPI001F342DAB|nr:hypothetical protein [Mycobacteroides abscessus]